MNYYVTIDIEATGNVNVATSRIIEIALVMIKNDDIIYEYSTLVNPQIPIPRYITSLTGITDQDVEHAPLFSDVAEKVKSIIGDYDIVGHNVLFDVRFLNKELELNGYNPLTNKTIDTVELSKILYPTLLHYKLSYLSHYFNLSHNTPHRALSDAIVTGDLFLKLKHKLFNLPKQTKDQLSLLTDELHSDLDHLLMKSKQMHSSEDNFVSFNGLTFKNIFAQQDVHKDDINMSYGQLIEQLYNHEGILATNFPNYELRSSQQKMSELIYDAFRSRRHALIEAATGTGKTIAYLIPALYKAVKNNEQLVISTEKINLQLQLVQDELPKLNRLLPFSFRYTTLKGKSHYLSLEQFSKQLHVKENNYNKSILKAMIIVWLTETTTGDLNELNLPEGTADFAKRMSAMTNKANTPWTEYCYYNHAYKKAEQAHIVIVNHALLSADLHMKQHIIPPYDKLIIDEAHHFPDIAEEQFSLTINFKYVRQQINKLKFMQDEKAYVTLTHTIHEFSNYIVHLLFNEKDKEQVITMNDQHKMTWSMIVDMVNRIVYSLDQLMNVIEHKLGESSHTELSQLQNLKDQFQPLTHYSTIDQFVVSFKQIQYEQKQFLIYIYDKNVQHHLEQKLFAEKKSVILTSGTLTVNDSFSYFINQFGLNKFNVMQKSFKSPFNLNEQVNVMVPSDFPPVDDDDFTYVATELIYSLTHMLNGNILILFTSHQMLKSVYYLLAEVIGLQYNLIAQNITHRHHFDLINAFKSSGNSILLGTNSLWEGIDIPGEHLTGLIIVKLPFDNPNDIKYKAKQTMFEDQQINDFYHYMLPRMIIRLKQGMGRLIRTKTDKGVIFILDNRLKTASYSDYVISSIKQYPVSYDSTKTLMDHTMTFFDQKKTDT